MKKKYKEVKELNGIKLGKCKVFNDTEDEWSEVLNIFPNGNNVQDKSKPYYVRNSIGAIYYYSREQITQ